MKIFRKLIEQLELANRRHALFRRNDTLLLCVSGGGDSMALLGLMLALKKKYSWRLTVAHLDHGLQKNSRQAQRLVQRVCEKNNIPFYSKKVQVRAAAIRHKLSLEDAGRRERYLFFGSVAKKVRADKIVTAHTLDDQAETVLMRLLRGSGFRGLSGIPDKRAEGRTELLRPLLSCSKKDLIAFVKKMRLPFVRDLSNRDTRFLRNRVRHRLLPLLRRHFNPRIDEQLASLQKVCRDVQRYMDRNAAMAYGRCVTRRTSREIYLRVEALKKFPAAIQSEVLLLALSELKGDGAGFTHSHIQSILDVTRSMNRRAETHLPHGLRARRTGQKLVIHHARCSL